MEGYYYNKNYNNFNCFEHICPVFFFFGGDYSCTEQYNTVSVPMRRLQRYCIFETFSLLNSKVMEQHK